MTFGATSTTDDVLSGVDLHGKRILVIGVSAGLGVETARTREVASAKARVGKRQRIRSAEAPLPRMNPPQQASRPATRACGGLHHLGCISDRFPCEPGTAPCIWLALEVDCADSWFMQPAMAQFTLEINGQQETVEAVAEMPLLWVLRDLLNMTGTKYGCGIGLCGACTVHIDGRAARSCQTPVATAVGKRIVTIEGLGTHNLHPVQEAWIVEQVPQCGYCQPGQLMSAAALLAQNTEPADSDIDTAMAGNICRCATYFRIRKAIHRAAELTHS